MSEDERQGAGHPDSTGAPVSGGEPVLRARIGGEIAAVLIGETRELVRVAAKEREQLLGAHDAEVIRRRPVPLHLSKDGLVELAIPDRAAAEKDLGHAGRWIVQALDRFGHGAKIGHATFAAVVCPNRPVAATVALL